MKKGYEIAVVGGAGHVGAPLSILMASRGLRTLIHDIDARAIATLASGRMHFFEDGGEPLLKQVLAADMLGFSTNISDLAGIPFIVLTIGTLIDEFNNPMVQDVIACVDSILPHLGDDSTLVLRSTVFPGVTDYVHRYLQARGKKTLVAFCPERVVQGYSLRELQSLPQIVSGTTPAAEERVATLFARFSPSLVRMAPKEAEFAKLFTNAYRYIQFAASNQFYMMAEAAGVDYGRILSGMKEDYPRMRDLPGAGFAAGPCLYKDTFQLVASANNQFSLGLAAIQINEGLPAFLVAGLKARCALHEKTVGLLGMAFKANSDDIRSSLSYKLKKLLRFEAGAVLTTDPFVKNDPDLLPLDEVIERSDVVVVCAPHSAYRGLALDGKIVVDAWNFLPRAEAALPVARVAEAR